MMLQYTALRTATSLRPVTTAHLAQTMALLELTAMELNQKIENELANNPALELREERICPTCQRPLPGRMPCPRCSTPKSLASDEPIVFVSPREDFHIHSGLSAEEMPEDNMSAATEDLPTFVLRQIAPELKPEDRKIAAHILTNLNDYGLLDVPLVEIARYHHLPLSRIESVLYLIQHAEPVGVGSPTPEQALLIQLEVLQERMAVPAGTDRAIREGMDLLSRRQYMELGKLLGIPTRQAQEIAKFIAANLHPHPARAFWGEIHQGNEAAPSVYSSPDVIITKLSEKDDSPLVVEIVAPYSGQLQINPMFRQAISQAPSEKAEAWKADLDRADLLVKCLQQRIHTIVRLMRRLTVLQREYIINGDKCLQPITRATLAVELELHESTISRAVSSKTVQLPNGHIVPLSKFFDRSLHVRTALKQLINQEGRPLSDNELVKLLQKQGYDVARRTVAKYRSMEGILPSHLRQNKFISEAA